MTDRSVKIDKKMPKVVDKKEKKEKILESAIRVFSKQGRTSTKISDIAEEAGIGKGTIYEYFLSKDELFSASFDFFIEKLEETIAHQLLTLQDPLEKLHTYFDAWTEMMEGEYLDYLEIVLDFWAEGVRKKDESWKIDWKRVYSENIKILEALLDECVAKAEIKPVDTKLVAAAMLGVLDGLLIQWILNRSAFEIKKASQLFIDTFIEGLKK
jgi:AcrR family transcriptional regulator